MYFIALIFIGQALPKRNVVNKLCRDEPELALLPVSIENVSLQDKRYLWEDSVINQISNGNSVGEVVYEVGHLTDGDINNKKYIYYVNDRFSYDEGSELMSFQLESYCTSCSPLWYVLLPPAIVLDILLSPVLIPMWINYGDAH